MTYEEGELAFNKSIDALQAKYEDILQHKINAQTGKMGDLLTNHFHIVNKKAPVIWLEFHKGTYLPLPILDEIRTLFWAHFSFSE
jgi:hypothetical protein